jgi:LmbE family N-acetylglucosaminyl deacetylase
MTHPDDVDFWAAGTVARWVAEEAAEVTYLLVTSGDAGGFDRDLSRDRVTELRRSEQRRAAGIVGVTDVRFLEGYHDGAVNVTDGLVRDLCRAIRQVRPDRVLAQSPERNWEDIPASHPDHLAVGEAVVRAVYPFARNPFAFPELMHDAGLEPWVVHDLWLQGHPAPNTAVDVTAQWDRRLAALAAHVSQHPDPAQMERDLRRDLAAGAARFGLADGVLAETFRRVHID